MKIKKLVLTATVFLVAMCGILSENIQEVQAEETTTPVIEEVVSNIIVEVNSTDAFDQIKTSLINEDADVNASLVDIAQSDMTIGHVDTTKVGTQEVNVLINIKPLPETTELMKSSISSKVTLHVVDTYAPTLVLTTESKNVQLNSEFNPWDYLSYVYDNSKENMYDVLQINNPVDPNTEGDYVVSYIATDSSNNETAVDLNVQVRKRIVVNGGVASGDEINLMLQLINNVRAEYGYNALQLADEAGQTAIAIRAAESVNNITHRRPDGSHYKTALSDQGVSWDHSPLEILTSAGGGVEGKLNWWLNSSGHRSILLQPNYDTIAIGYSGSMWAAIVY